MFIGLLILALAYAGYIIVKSAKSYGYGSSLEQYIVDRNPQHSGDVEKFTAEYNLKITRGLL